jgi:3,4-dihydroxy 2-butanone 4-phosphate synthase/GTP cyclohydrolase II
MAGSSTVHRRTSARIPTNRGTFQLYFYQSSRDEKEHLALVVGEVTGEEDVLVRIHSECFTGDVLGSLRCDCGEQLDRSLRLITEEGQGVLIYLRQEGRGIGLLDKLRAYNLQDIGYDTVEANIMLGHAPDERDYDVAFEVIRDLGLSSIRLLTNNLEKLESLEAKGVKVVERVPIQPVIHEHNEAYLATKAERMRHLITLGKTVDYSQVMSNGYRSNVTRAAEYVERTGRPYTTLSYAQSLDGSLAVERGKPMRLSGPESLTMTHRLRALNEGIMVGIGTVVSDDPRLTVRRVPGAHPRPIIIDSELRFPLNAAMLEEPSPVPWILTTERAPADRRAKLERAGLEVVPVKETGSGAVDLRAALEAIGARGIHSVMIEGGARIITSILAEQLADHLVLTVASVVVGGLHAVGDLQGPEPPIIARLEKPQYRWCGEDLVVRGDFSWE